MFLRITIFFFLETNNSNNQTEKVDSGMIKERSEPAAKERKECQEEGLEENVDSSALPTKEGGRGGKDESKVWRRVGRKS